jgi:hypothetical protein
MAANRPTTRELSDARDAQRRADMQVAIEEGTLTVRQMTPLERKDSHALRAAGAEARAARAGNKPRYARPNAAHDRAAGGGS